MTYNSAKGHIVATCSLHGRDVQCTCKIFFSFFTRSWNI